MWVDKLLVTAAVGGLMAMPAYGHDDHRRHRGHGHYGHGHVHGHEIVYAPVVSVHPIGRQFGDGSGRDALTVMGAIAGSAVAHGYAVRRNSDAAYAVPVEQCHVVNERFTDEVIEGYDVAYRYLGRTYTMRTARHPGNRIPLEVGFRPARL
jgi:uncharacterized protein YcfJ